MEKIEGFSNEYGFLSNFYPSTVYLDGLRYPTVEHAYQASKTNYSYFRQQISELPASKAADVKRMGKTLPLRHNWNRIKLSIMEDLVRQKFTRNPVLRRKLIETGDAYIEETNNWGDIYWGVSGGVGTNHLGNIIMKIRAEVKESQS